MRSWCWLPILLLLEALTGCGGSGSSSSLTPSSISVTVAPNNSSVPAVKTQTFVATVTGTTNTAVSWNVNGVAGGNSTVGTISAFGLYTAPVSVPSPPNVSVNAVSQADPSKSGSATVTILPPGTGNVNQAAQSFPIKLGTSGGNDKDLTTASTGTTCCSGTLGALVTRGSTQFILSTNHVLARRDQASVGEPITQPGLVDTNCNPGQLVANFSQAAPLKTSNVDAALAAVVPGAVDPSGPVLGLGDVGGSTTLPAPPASTLATPAINLSVAKSGRTTGLTCGSIGTINATVQVDFQPGCNSGTTFTVAFTNQIVVNGSSFSASGDSGSLLVTSQTAQPVGLLFGGSTTNTVANPIQDVLLALKDSAGVTPTVVGAGQHPIACPASGSAPAQQVSLSEAEVSRATAVMDQHTGRLMGDPAVLGVGVGASADRLGEAAVVLYLERGRPHGPIPTELEGVRTKIIRTDRFHIFGASGQIASAGRPESVAGVSQRIPSEAEVGRATAAKDKHVSRLMGDPAVLGVGVGASDDNPEEAAVVVFLEQGKSHAPVPVQLDGVRTKVVTTDRFRAYGGNKSGHRTCALR